MIATAASRAAASARLRKDGMAGREAVAPPSAAREAAGIRPRTTPSPTSPNVPATLCQGELHVINRLSPQFDEFGGKETIGLCDGRSRALGVIPDRAAHGHEFSPGLGGGNGRGQ